MGRGISHCPKSHILFTLPWGLSTVAQTITILRSSWPRAAEVPNITCPLRRRVSCHFKHCGWTVEFLQCIVATPNYTLHHNLLIVCNDCKELYAKLFDKFVSLRQFCWKKLRLELCFFGMLPHLCSCAIGLKYPLEATVPLSDSKIPTAKATSITLLWRQLKLTELWGCEVMLSHTLIIGNTFWRTAFYWDPVIVFSSSVTLLLLLSLILSPSVLCVWNSVTHYWIRMKSVHHRYF